MNREKFINKFDKDTGYFVNNPNNALHLARYNFILLIEKAELIQKENTRLKKQLSKDHHIKCSCSFCKPVNSQLKEDLEDYNTMVKAGINAN